MSTRAKMRRSRVERACHLANSASDYRFTTLLIGASRRLVAILGACVFAATAVPACSRETAAALSVREDSIAGTYMRFVREQLNAADPYPLELALQCEVQRLFVVLTTTQRHP